MAISRVCKHANLSISSKIILTVPSYPALDPELEHHNFVGELLFWTAVYNFPQEMITFLLSMLPDNTYKVQ